MDDRFSLQLFSVRNELKKNFKFTLRSVAEMGYTGVEFAGDYGGMSAPELRALLDELGLTCVGAHVSLELLENDFDAQADYLETLGCPHIVCPWAYIHDEASAKEHGAKFEEIAVKCAMRGFRFSYHNHDHEFAKTEDGRYLDDVMMDSCSELVMAELDVFWIAMAGADPVRVIRQYPGRMELLHLKQMGWKDGEKVSVLFGQGVLDLADLSAHGKLMGITDLIVEEETPCDDMLDAVRQDIEDLRRMEVSAE